MIEEYITYGILVVLGAMLGSYAAATVWRLRAKQLQYDETHGEKVTKKEKQEIANLQKRSVATDRSVCLHCGRQLAWFDLLPIVSWLALRGKCRTCHKPIGTMELFAEIGMAAAFTLSYALWPYALETAPQQVLFAVWLAIVVLLAIHWMYDAKWQVLLNKITIYLGILSVVYAGLYVYAFSLPLMDYALQIGLLLLILPGFYTILYIASGRSWIGLGDIYLLIPFALLLPSWEYGILTIFLANFIGTLAVLPGMVLKKITRTSRVPFGPFLIAGFIATVLVGPTLLAFYLQSLM